MSNKYIQTDTVFNLKKVDNFHQELPSGCYTTIYDGNADQVYFVKFDPKCDNIVDLPSSEYDYIVKQMQFFLKPETRAKFNEYGFIYKRSALLYGRPGTGKSVLVNRIIQEALTKNAIVLFNPNPILLDRIYRDLTTSNPTSLCLVVFEEFDGILSKGRDYEEALLSILDGEIQRDNVMYLATTNHIDQIPARLKRPGRFGSIVEVSFPTAEARAVYLQHKRIDKTELDPWVKKTEGFSIDELKETVLSVKCLNYKLDDVIGRIVKNKENPADYVDPEDDEDYDDDLDGVFKREYGAAPAIVRKTLKGYR